MSEYHKSILAGYKLKQRKPRELIGKEDGKLKRSSIKPHKDIGQSMDHIRVGLDSELFNRLEDYCKDTGMNRQEVIRLALRYHLNVNI